MKFGQIDYLNLLPFRFFIKSSSLSSPLKAGFSYRRSYPAKITERFLAGHIDAAFISSIEARGAKKSCAGIVANGEVQSVLCRPGDAKKDAESKSSNALCDILGLHGEVLIGDKALKAYLAGGEFIDMGEAWKRKTALPFVFALLCYNKNGGFFERIAKRFTQKKIVLPQYILRSEAKKRGIAAKDARSYLKKISYKVGKKEQMALKIFWSKAKK